MRNGGLALHSPHAYSGPLFAQRFRISKRIENGGHANVFAGYDLHTGIPVAVKMLGRNKRTSQDLSRFQREIETLVTIGPHPNIVFLFYFSQKAPYIYVMERAEGTFTGVISLFQERMLAGSLWQSELRIFLTYLCNGLSAIHNAGYLHLDIKPANLLIGLDGCLRYSDFGLAVPEGTRIPCDSVEGTPHYVAPERIPITDAPFLFPDTRSDIYSLGVILFELLTGHFPFDGKTAVDILYGHAFNPVPCICAPTSLDPRLVSLVRRMLAKDPDMRPQSAQEVLACAQQVLEG